MIGAAFGTLGMLVLAAAGIPIALAMAVTGFVGFGLIIGWGASMSMVGQTAFDMAFSYNLSVLPLFILMGNFITRAQLSEDLFAAAYAFVGRLPGGLAISSILACAGFSAVSGSSLATAATMAKVAMPSMRKFGYKPSLAAGSIAAGGTLGILIPPSVALVLYGILTENDIGKLFLAGILPGILGAFLYCCAALTIALIDPSAGPRGERTSWPERFRVLRRIWGVATLFTIVIGGIYAGLFTSTEAAGIGAAASAVFAILRGRLSFPDIVEVLVSTARMTAAIFAILIGALIFTNFINVANILQLLNQFVDSMGLTPFGVLFFVLAVYVILGMFLESMSMLLLTIPIFYPLIIANGFDPIWFGIVVVVVIEIGLITPPVGMNVFIIRSTMPEIPLNTIFRGVLPFVLSDIIRLMILVFVPSVVLFLASS